MSSYDDANAKPIQMYTTPKILWSYKNVKTSAIRVQNVVRFKMDVEVLNQEFTNQQVIN